MTMPLAQFAELCRKHNVEGFMNLRQLLSSDIEAAKAMREETRFVASPEWESLAKPTPGSPEANEFARKVRQRLIDNHLEWNFDNLLAASRAVLAEKESV
jgi:hypothetical protein